MTHKQLREKDYLKKPQYLRKKTLKNEFFKSLGKHLTVVVKPFNPSI